jgi:hypothetical protein
MVTAFHKARFEVEVEDVVIGGSEAKENALMSLQSNCRFCYRYI